MSIYLHFTFISDIICPLFFGERKTDLTERYLGLCPFYGRKAIKVTNERKIKMSLTKEKKQQLVKEYAIKDGDTGSPEVQVAVLSAEISALSEHLKKHPNDIHSTRGLNARVANRRRLLSYLKNNDQARYDALVKRLKLRK